jgi:hypothetical protein
MMNIEFQNELDIVRLTQQFRSLQVSASDGVGLGVISSEVLLGGPPQYL